KLLKLEMKILADIGFVGLPNAGKSTLLSVLTAARPEIADYPFTTIQPNLGVMEVPASSSNFAALSSATRLPPDTSQNSTTAAKRNFVIADIPGLIEDAHKGKGLGINFLKHIERCKVLVYIIAPDLGKSDLSKQLEMVKREVREYGQEVINKSSIVVINKIDLLDQEQRARLPKDWIQVSAATTEGIEALKFRLVELYNADSVAGL
ncbi:MAG TPA: GTPase, partial [Anaerolineales bacterium]|nr:GTPase [Anaerolineales bacterium]